MAAASVSTVEVAALAAAECVTAVEVSATMEVSASAPMKVFAAAEATVKVAASWSIEAVPVIIKVAAPAEVTVVEAPSSIVAAAKPRPGANEDAAREPVRPVVAIGRARVRIISIVAVRAHRRTVHGARIHWAAYSDAH